MSKLIKFQILTSEYKLFKYYSYEDNGGINLYIYIANIKHKQPKTYENFVKNNTYIEHDMIASLSAFIDKQEENDDPEEYYNGYRISIKFIDVNPNYRSNGIATYLILYTLTFGKELIPELELVLLDDDSNNAHSESNLYTKLDFTYINKKPFPEMKGLISQILKNYTNFKKKTMTLPKTNVSLFDFRPTSL